MTSRLITILAVALAVKLFDLHLGAELNWRRLFEASLEGFSEEALAARQAAALAEVGLA